MILFSSLILAIFVIIAIIHLIHSYQGKLGLSDISKFFLMPLLMAFYVFACISQGFTVVSVLLLIALTLFWIGDILLIYDWERASFYFGIFTFLIAQCLLITISIMFFQYFSFPIIVALILAIAYCIILYLKLLFLHRPFAFIGLRICASAYLISTTVLSYLLVCFAIANPNLYSILMAVAGVFFMFSDYHVIQEYYISGNKLSRFIIMLGYLVGISLIVIACVAFEPLLLSKF